MEEVGLVQPPRTRRSGGVEKVEVETEGGHERAVGAGAVGVRRRASDKEAGRTDQAEPEEVFERSYQHWAQRVRAAQKDIDLAHNQELEKLRIELASYSARQTQAQQASPNPNSARSPPGSAMSNRLPPSDHPSRSSTKPDLAQSTLPNQNNAIHYSSNFANKDDKKPVPLAHFMGARRDLHGPVLTKQRIDENEVRPEGWELAERRFEILSKQANAQPGLSSLASLLSSPSPSASAPGLASHAANSSKRALPGMVPHQQHSPHLINPSQKPAPPSAEPAPTGLDKYKQRSLPNPPSSSSSQPTNSHADAYLKPKSLADRLALLGVATDVQPLKTHSSSNQTPPVSLTSSPQVEKSAQADKPPPTHQHRVNKSKSTFTLRRPPEQQPAIDFEHHSRPLSSYMPSPRPLPSPTTPQAGLPSSTDASRQPFSLRDNIASNQHPTSSHPHKIFARPQSVFPLLDGHHQQGPPESKLPTASLSRLAGSNIVAQRLQWSKEREQQRGPVDEFGTPGGRPAPSPGLGSQAHQNQNLYMGAQIPSPVFPPGPALAKPGFVDLSSKSDRDRDPARSPHHARHHSAHSQTQPGSQQAQQKHTNQFNKTARLSSDDDDRPSATSGLPGTKRNKRSAGGECERERGASVARKPSGATSPPPRSPNKHRLRGIHRSTPPAAARVELLPRTPTQTATGSGSRVPSLAAFEPKIRKGTSAQMAAVWERSSSTAAHKKGTSIGAGEQAGGSGNGNGPIRPLPVPPVCVAPSPRMTTTTTKTTTVGHRPSPTTESRPLPVLPPSSGKKALGGGDVDHRRGEARGVVGSEEHARRSGLVGPVTGSGLLAAYKQRCTRLSGLGDGSGSVKVEVFQINRTGSEELCTTMVDLEDQFTFYSEEGLLLVFRSQAAGRVDCVVWQGADAEGYVDADKQQEALKGLVEMYGGTRQEEVVVVRQGHEPHGLVRALGGRLVVRTGDRFDSVYQRTREGMFVCKGYGDPLVVVIEEGPVVQSRLCTADCALVKVCSEENNGNGKGFNGKKKVWWLYVWKGKNSCSKEGLEVLEFARRVKNESSGGGGGQVEVIEVEEGLEPEGFRRLFGCGGNGNGQVVLEDYARSYYWKTHKEEVLIEPLLICSSTGTMIDRVSRQEITVLYTGLEVMIIVPPSCSGNVGGGGGKQGRERGVGGVARGKVERAVQVALKLVGEVYHDGESSGGGGGGGRQGRKVAVNCLVFPTIVPVDLKAAVRFGYEFDRLNEKEEIDGDRGIGGRNGNSDKMKLISLNEVIEFEYNV